VVNHRFAPDRDPEEAAAHVRDIIGIDLDADDRYEIVDLAAGAAPGLDHPLLAALIERNALPVRAKLGWTDVARFAARGIPAANFGPGDPTLAHAQDECVRLEPIERVYGALVDLVRGGAAP
jgi:succinyl-diaminopimelate desuccinylase